MLRTCDASGYLEACWEWRGKNCADNSDNLLKEAVGESNFEFPYK